MEKKVLLAIMDGVGLNTLPKERNAFRKAETPNLRKLVDTYPHSVLEASGLPVGLPEGQMGNSETGHTNIGAGRIVYQMLVRINKAIEDGSFYKNKTILKAINHAKKHKSNLHVMGLLSEGGIHSNINHIYALLKMAKDNGLENVYVHAFMDGRDTSPTAGKEYINSLQNKMEEIGLGKIASISGRYYAMDRDKVWERVAIAYGTVVNSENGSDLTPLEYMKFTYENEITDEFILPKSFNNPGIKDADSVIHANFRPDRIIELLSLIEGKENDQIETIEINKINTTTMTFVHDSINATQAFPQTKLKNTLGEYLAKKGKSQLRIAETTKYPHVTYFFDGGEEKELKKADRILVDTPDVATFDMMPEMSAYEITKKLLERLNSDAPDVTVLNFANGDMVGHTGNIEAATIAVETVDNCIGKLYDVCAEKGITMMITADHGNCDEMIDEDGKALTSHSVFPVPFIVTDENITLKNGKLADIAPTMLNYLNMRVPKEMTGENLLKK